MAHEMVALRNNDSAAQFHPFQMFQSFKTFQTRSQHEDREGHEDRNRNARYLTAEAGARETRKR